MFDHQFREEVHPQAVRKAVERLRKGFSGAAMLPYGELEYGEIMRIPRGV
jgi:hypothetical protein